MIAVLGEDKRRASTIGIYALLFVLTNFVNKVSFKAMIAYSPFTCIQWIHVKGLFITLYIVDTIRTFIF